MTNGPEDTAPTRPAEPELDSAMATGNDEGEPGPPPSPADGSEDGAAVEETAGAELAVHDDAPLDASALPAPDAEPDPRDPQFHEPGA
ncbi:hypothetical protein MO973_16705 [Paenibacillus sp. TRM 82003]|uniref:hypothetical protein n=1 Tax=Kineococcus sp. TRM81007 TaxID=2925831 RepID=UPI001F5704A8|nr:hypothetical protein [Kineococcus sp. TRM81007]MCI2237555.1 hypothetical protein [Kineococcus sp. TRM81007]MCI3921873.1 hypothetical protein [Paenibacillus sp. TRM 82003]